MATASAVHILVKTKEEALAILAELKKGKKFDQLAKKTLYLPIRQERR